MSSQIMERRKMCSGVSTAATRRDPSSWVGLSLKLEKREDWRSFAPPFHARIT